MDCLWLYELSSFDCGLSMIVWTKHLTENETVSVFCCVLHFYGFTYGVKSFSALNGGKQIWTIEVENQFFILSQEVENHLLRQYLRPEPVFHSYARGRKAFYWDNICVPYEWKIETEIVKCLRFPFPPENDIWKEIKCHRELS